MYQMRVTKAEWDRITDRIEALQALLPCHSPEGLGVCLRCSSASLFAEHYLHLDIKAITEADPEWPQVKRGDWVQFESTTLVREPLLFRVVQISPAHMTLVSDSDGQRWTDEPVAVSDPNVPFSLSLLTGSRQNPNEWTVMHD